MCSYSRYAAHWPLLLGVIIPTLTLTWCAAGCGARSWTYFRLCSWIEGLFKFICHLGTTCKWHVKICCWYTAHWLLLLGDDQSHSDFNFVCITVVLVHGSKVDTLQLRRSLGNDSVSVTTAAFTKDGWQQTTSSLPRLLLLTTHNGFPSARSLSCEWMTFT